MRNVLRNSGMLLAVVLLAAGPVRAKDGLLYDVALTYQVQLDSTVDKWTPVDDGQLHLRPGMSGTDFLGDASVTVVIAEAGDEQYLVDFTLTTLPPMARVVSRQVVLDEHRDINILGLKYKHNRNARVQIKITSAEGDIPCDLGGPRGARDVQEFISNIPFHGAPSMVTDSTHVSDDQLWYSDPSAHFEVYYIPNSFGDFAWNMVRDYLEKELQQFQSVFDFKAMQRVNYFVAPCEVPEIAWSKNRMWAIDPVTFKAYAVFNRDQREITGIATNMNYLYRTHGYAPMALVEGVARGFEYNHYYAKQLMWRGQLPSVFKNWNTLKYRNSNDSGLQIAAGSMVNFLIGTRGLPKFWMLYGVVDDFNLDSAFTGVYGETPQAFEKDWRHFLDTMKVLPHVVNYFYSRSKAIGRNDESIDLLKALVQVDTVRVDQDYNNLALLYFLEGRYEDVLYALKQADKLKMGKGKRAQMANSARFFLGRLDDARRGYDSLLTDTTDQGAIGAVDVMYAWLELTDGHPEKAEKLLKKLNSAKIVLQVDRMESELMLGRIRRAEGKDSVADSLYESVLGRVRQALADRPTQGDLYMRAGEAYVGLGQPDTAFTYLDMAQFLETRPYYEGRVWVAIGNAYDLLGMRDYALEYYKKVLKERSSYPARVMARKYIREPYSVPGV